MFLIKPTLWQLIKAVTLYVFIVSLSACTSINSDKSLYSRLGKVEGITQITHYLIEEIAQDDIVFPFFKHSKVDRFRKHFIDHLCDLSGGPCQYEGDTITDIHANMKITEKAFNRLVELLINAMDKASISYTTQNQLLYRLAPMRKDII